MKRSWLVLGFLAACGGGGGSDPKDVARGFVEAVAAGDVARAQGYLPDDAACEKATGDDVAHCKKSAQLMREHLPDVIAKYPRGAKVTRVERSAEASPDPRIALWEIDLDGKPDSEVMTVELGGRVYAAFPIKVEDAH